MNWPGYHYLGPGNKTDNGEPINKVDEIAKWHDDQYSQAKTACDIIKADEIAIEKFRNEFENSHLLTAKVGEIGLSVKTVVEKHTGVLYPKDLEDQGKTFCNVKQSRWTPNKLFNLKWFLKNKFKLRRK